MSIGSRIAKLEANAPEKSEPITIVRSIYRPAGEGENGPQLVEEIDRGTYRTKGQKD